MTVQCLRSGQSLQVVCYWAGRQVRFGPKADLMPMPMSVAHASLPSVTEPRSMTIRDQVNATPASPSRVPWNKGKLTGAKAAAAKGAPSSGPRDL